MKEDANNYSPSEGIPELKQAIVEKEKRVNNVNLSTENVIVTSGTSEGIQMVIAALIGEGDEILVPGPTYPPYISYTKCFGGSPVAYEIAEREEWQPNIDDLRSKISKNTRAIVVINPNNPCGALYKEKTIKQIIDLAGEHDLPILSDEIYDQITYSQNFRSSAHLAGDVPVVGLNGFSKVQLMTGWRLGYVYFHQEHGQLEDLKQCVEKEARIRICANTPVQKAGIAALNGPQDHVRDLVTKLRQRRDYAWNRLNEIEGLSCAKPEGAFYVFPKILGVGSTWETDLEFALDLLRETGVLLVHGSGFSKKYGSGHVRGVFLPPINMLEQAFNKIEQFMEKKKRLN